MSGASGPEQGSESAWRQALGAPLPGMGARTGGLRRLIFAGLGLAACAAPGPDPLELPPDRVVVERRNPRLALPEAREDSREPDEPDQPGEPGKPGELTRIGGLRGAVPPLSDLTPRSDPFRKEVAPNSWLGPRTRARRDGWSAGIALFAFALGAATGTAPTIRHAGHEHGAYCAR